MKTNILKHGDRVKIYPNIESKFGDAGYLRGACSDKIYEVCVVKYLGEFDEFIMLSNPDNACTSIYTRHVQKVNLSNEERVTARMEELKDAEA